MPNCGLCGKFLSTKDCMRCAKCTITYHRHCGQAPATGPTPPGWTCQPCKIRSSKGFLSPDDIIMQTNLNPDLPTISNELLLELTREIKCLRSDFTEMRKEISELKTSLITCCNWITILEEKITTLEQKLENKNQGDTGHLENTITELKQRLDDREQELLLNDLEISGIPESSSVSVIHIVKLTALKLSVQIEDRDIVYAERLGFIRRNRIEEEVLANQRPRTIVVRLSRRVLRNGILHAARVRRGLSTAYIELPGDSRKLFTNERLTRKNRILFEKAREAAYRQKWRYIWTRNGSIFARKEEGKAVERIRTESDVSKIFPVKLLDYTYGTYIYYNRV